MHLSRLLLRALVPCLLIQVVLPQELPFEIPVQLIGFPVIILAVRLSNFLKKLSYAVNPNTYRSRARRGSEHAAIDIADIEKKLILEMGDKVCVYEDVCQEYADKVNHNENFVLDWQDIFRHYEKFPRGKKEFYLLSVFMGDIVKSRELCSQLAKRGRSCNSTSSGYPSNLELLDVITKVDHQRAGFGYQTEKRNASVSGHSKVAAPLEPIVVSLAKDLVPESKIHLAEHPDQPESYHQTSHHSEALPKNNQESSHGDQTPKNLHHIRPNYSQHHSLPHHHQPSQIHHQVHRHHVEIHYDAAHERNQGLLFGQHPPHHIHHSSGRTVHSQS